MKLSDVTRLLRTTLNQWFEDKASRLAAALAYYTAISLAPILVIILALTGAILGEEAARGEIAHQTEWLWGNVGSAAVQEIIKNASRPSSGVLATLISIGALLFGASGVFGALQDGLNTIWEVIPKPGREIMAIIKERFISLAMVLGVGFLLLVSFVISSALAAFGKYFAAWFYFPGSLTQVMNLLLSTVVITFLFAVIFKALPDVKIAWKDVWLGALLTSILFSIGKYVIGEYVGRSAIGSAYGAAGSLVAILIWVYYSAQILFLGAEFTRAYALQFGSHVELKNGALPLTEHDRVQQGIPRNADLKC